jgi:hypothetical protein
MSALHFVLISVGLPAAANAQSAKPRSSSDTEGPDTSAAAAVDGTDAQNRDTHKLGSAPATGVEAKDTTQGNAKSAQAETAEDGQIIGKVPLVAPPPEAPKPVVAAQRPTMAGQVSSKDELDDAGYLPGYKRYISLGQSPYSPPVAALPGGFTPGFAAPMPAKTWTLNWAGSANVSAQYSGMSRRDATSAQSSYALHTPPRTIEEYSSFTSSSTIPGNWVSLRFNYGTSKVSANVSIDTWNPTEPTSFYQMGSQSNINNAFLSYTPEPFGKLRLRVNAGQMYNGYGFLGVYGGGVYVNPLAGVARGIGELISVEYDLTDRLTLNADHGFMMSKDGTPPSNSVPDVSNGFRRLYWAGSFVDHAHLGLTLNGPFKIQAELHYFDAFFHDDRTEAAVDNPNTQEIDESYVKDPRIRTYAADVRIAHDVWGTLGVGVSYIAARHAYPLKGISTYGGDGEWLTDRWFGATTGGTGDIMVAAINYGVSLGRVAASPAPFSGNGPDLVLNTGLHWTKTWTDYQPYDGRIRWKGAVDALYSFIKYMGVGVRFDHIVPNSYDTGETYNVLATRLQFKTDWTSRETLMLMYGKWFYGPRTRNEGTGLRTPDRMDDQMFALNFNIWW